MYTATNLPSQYSTPVVFSEEHTPDNPYCSCLDCSCHSSESYHQQVTQSHQYSEQELQQALNFLTSGRE